MRTFRWGALVAAAAVSALVVASQVSARGAADTIKIGISLPITGNFSEPGTAAQKGYQIWADITNKSGGLLGRKVQLVIKDDQSDQNTIVNDYNGLINNDKVDLLLGTFSSLLNLPASAVAEKFHMVYVEPAGGSYVSVTAIYATNPAGSSISAASVSRNSAPRAPSTTR